MFNSNHLHHLVDLRLGGARLAHRAAATAVDTRPGHLLQDLGATAQSLRFQVGHPRLEVCGVCSVCSARCVRRRVRGEAGLLFLL